MKKIFALAGIAGAGAGLMYLFDPDRGKRRRAMLRNKVEHASRVTMDAAGKTKRDVQNHLRGLTATLGPRSSRKEATDELLNARVRSAMGRVVSHPHSISVVVRDGTAILRGPILKDEVRALLDLIAEVDGVKDIDNWLEVHESADIPALQGGYKRHGERFGPFKMNWSPTTRLAATAVGGALTLYGTKRRGLVGSGMSLLGTALVTRAVTNFAFRKLVGVDGHAAGFSVEKTIHINAPIDDVFTYWSHPENFPEFMSHVRKVRKIGEGIYHWTVRGPAGLSIEWNAQITDLEFNKLYAWKSLPGSTVSQTGIARFKSTSDGSTQIDVKMSYLPPAGAFGHVIAELFSVDPKQEMNDDLMRMKSYLETRVHPHDAARHVSISSAA